MSSDPTPSDGSTPAQDVDHDDHPDVLAINTRNATILFLVYLLAYAGFMLLAAISPKSMGVRVLAGVNLAVIYGIGLIVLAVLLAVVYMWLCARTMDQFKKRHGGRPPASPTVTDEQAQEAAKHEGGQA